MIQSTDKIKKLELNDFEQGTTVGTGNSIFS